MKNRIYDNMYLPMAIGWVTHDLLHPDKYKRLVEKTSTVGIDLDTLDIETYKATLGKCEAFGQVYDYRSKHGWHFKIHPREPVTLHHAFKIRYYCGDDYHRLCRDMIKAMDGRRVIDVLFDLKETERKSVIEK